ncbi:hypothetical protein ACLMJK_002723 [Lecanora helva]
MGSDSAYAISESDPPKWRRGEELAASGFVAIILFLFVDISLSIYRVFKKKQGLYYWCMVLGTWGCLIDAIAVILKSLRPNSETVWPLYTLFMVVGWTLYAPAQLLILYSRLHLVNQNHRLQRCVLIMIIVVSSFMIIPTWPLAWGAYNPYDQHLSSLYSPREAIIDRCTQIGYTITESIVSGIYIWSLLKLLRLKSSVRQRRVMTDLILVNVIAVCLDVLTVVLVFFNETGISHPVQTFSYILKLKLEFLVLNQLMSVAARGMQRETFAERRYHHPSVSSEKNESLPSSKTSIWGIRSRHDLSKADSVKELVLPSPTILKVPSGSNSDSTTPGTDYGTRSMKAKVKRPPWNNLDKSYEEDEDQEIGVHMWERHGKLVMEVPWFKRKGFA